MVSKDKHADTSTGRRESVAEHSWRVTLMAMLLEDEFPDIDINRVIRMCLIHDLGEAFTGDIPAFEKTGEQADKEEELLLEWIEGFPKKQRQQFKSLLKEMEALETKEVQFSPYLRELKEYINEQTREKISGKGCGQ
ncbi:MAG: HD family hydrolase [Lachnospiraceae bacterium]